jgi:hypothetical protein
MANLTVWGTKNIRGEVVVTAGVNDTLTLDVDGVNYTVTLAPKTYKTLRELHWSEFVGALNTAFALQGIPVDVKLGGALNDDGKQSLVVFVHKFNTGTERIENFGGNMKSLIFK